MDYIIIGLRERLYLLARGSGPDAPARMYAPGTGLSGVKPAAEFLEFGYWEPYEGPQEPLPGVPDSIFGKAPTT